MKTPMNVFNTAMKKKKKNRKGFSLVELIVVLVIMAILAAALVPTLIGYIRQTKESNIKNEAASCVSAAQTIASAAFADPNGHYVSKATGTAVDLTIYTGGGDDATFTDETCDVVEKLAEVPSTATVSAVTVTDGKVATLTYTSGDITVVYNGTNYTVF